MNRGLVVVVVTALLTIAALAQKQTKPWKEWTRKEAEKILSDSAWSRTQTESESSGSSDVTTNFGDTRGREEAVRSNAIGISHSLFHRAARSPGICPHA